MSVIHRIGALACLAMPLAFGVMEASAQNVQHAQGSVVYETVHGASLKNNLTGDSPDRAVAIYLPPSYEDSPDRRYAVLYLLHGFGDTHHQWFRPGAQGGGWGTLAETLDRAIGKGHVAEFLVVAPDQRTKLGGSFYTDSEATGNWEEFTVRELVSHVDSNYRTIDRSESRGIAGHSMGGYGAIKLAMKHPDVYQVVYGMNSALLGWARDLTPENQGYERAAQATPATLTPRDLYAMGFLCVAQAFSPNADHPPFFADLPYEMRDGQLRPSEPGFSNWAQNMPLYMVERYEDNLKKLRGLRFDSGYYDQFTHIPPTCRDLSERLKGLSIPHVFEEYNGDHRDRMWGEEGRLSTEVLPWFSRMLEHE